MYYTLLYESQLISERSRVSDPRLQDVVRFFFLCSLVSSTTRRLTVGLLLPVSPDPD